MKLRFDQGTAKPLNILCIGAHCDDIEIGCGGTLLALLGKFTSVELWWVVLSSTPKRARETVKSFELFSRGCRSKKLQIRKFHDGFFPYGGGPIKAFFEEMKKRPSPDLIFTHYRKDLHQDHRVVSELTWNTFRNHLILEYEIPKYDGDLGQPNFFVPIEEDICRKKIEYIMRTHVSQASKQWFKEEVFRAIMTIRGSESASPTGYAEAFYGRKVLLD